MTIRMRIIGDNAGNSHFRLIRSISVITCHRKDSMISCVCILFELKATEKRNNSDPLYQIRATLDAFNEHTATCLTSGKYLVMDARMNSWYLQP